MEYLERELLEELKQWLERPEILAIKGPRQSGKTTLLEMVKEPFKTEKIPKGLVSFIKAYSPASAVVVTKNFLGERMVDKTKVKFVPVVYF